MFELFRRDFMFMLSQAAASFGLAGMEKIAGQAADALNSIMGLSPEQVSALSSIRTVVDAMKGEEGYDYNKELRLLEKALNNPSSIGSSALIGLIKRFNHSLRTLMERSHDFLAPEEKYLNGQKLHEIFRTPEMQKVTKTILETAFHDAPDKHTRITQALDILTSPPERRSRIFNSRLGIDHSKSWAQELKPRVQEMQAMLEKELDTKEKIAGPINNLRAENCIIWAKVQTKDCYGYNIQVPRKVKYLNKSDGEGKVIGRIEVPAESWSEWAERTKAIAAKITEISPLSANIPHNTFHGGRIVVITEKDTIIDSFFKEYINPTKEETKKTPAPSLSKKPRDPNAPRRPVPEGYKTSSTPVSLSALTRA